MSESLFSRAAAIAEPPTAAAEPSQSPAAPADTPRGIALRRTEPRRAALVAEAAAPAGGSHGQLGAHLARVAADRPTPAPRENRWRRILGGGR